MTRFRASRRLAIAAAFAMVALFLAYPAFMPQTPARRRRTS